MRIRHSLLVLFIMALALPAIANSAKETFSTPAVEEVLVIGIRPGPELWRIEKDGRTAWIMGTLSPLPKAMKWHSLLVEDVLQQSQELILPPFSKSNIGFFKGLSLAPSMIGVKKSPGGKTLKDVLPAQLFSRWTTLKTKYLNHDRSVEKMRPLFAAEKLYASAINHVGLESDQRVVNTIKKIAHKNKILISTPVALFDFDNPKKVIKQFKQSAVNDEACFEKTLAHLEMDLEAMKARANAWAKGNIKTLTELDRPNQSEECNTAFLDAAVVKNSSLGDIPKRLKSVWLDSIKLALAKNKSTFAVLPIDLFYGVDGYLDALEAEGYSVIKPK